jgi:dGTPase
LAPYATRVQDSRGRCYPEDESATRTCYSRDRDRIIHSTAFRRLKHKTQVFVEHEGDYYRTRLTHSLEVAQLARSLARSLKVDEDLAETIALSHDLGHTPFGHAGERAMQAVMAPYGGFDHNAQTLRLVTQLEARYADFDGLNLSWETLEGLVKHSGPLIDAEGYALRSHADGTDTSRQLPYAIRVYQARQDLLLDRQASAEAQCAGIADDIAYDAHDLDDGLRAGLVAIDQLSEVPLLGQLLLEVRARHPKLDEVRLTQEVTRRLITRMVEDVIGEALRRVAQTPLGSADDVRDLSYPLIAFSAEMAEADRAIKAFLFKHVYRSTPVMAVMTHAEAAVRDLFAAFFANTDELPTVWRQGLDQADDARRARRVCDYIAGMTDRFALAEHARLFDDRVEVR